MGTLGHKHMDRHDLHVRYSFLICKTAYQGLHESQAFIKPTPKTKKKAFSFKRDHLCLKGNKNICGFCRIHHHQQQLRSQLIFFSEYAKPIATIFLFLL